MHISIIGAKSIPAKRGGGGIERHIEELAPRLAKKRNQVTVYVRSRFFEDSGYRGVKLEPVPSVVTKHFDTFTFSFIATVRVLFKKVDIIHYHGIGPSTLAWIPRIFKRKTKVISTFHSIDRFHKKWGAFARVFLRFAEWAAVTFPHETIAVSHEIQKYCKKKFRKDVHYIPNGTLINPYPGDDFLKEWNLKKDQYILTTGRFVPQKGIHYLIEAYADMETDKKLVIAGSGAIGSDYEDKIRKLAKGNSDIIFTGFQKDTRLQQLYANAFLYVHPSEAEGLPMSVLEAMAAGKCVLVSDIPENVESIDHSGLVFYNTDTEDLRDKLEMLIHHPDIVTERAGRAREWVESEYDWGKIVNDTFAIFKK